MGIFSFFTAGLRGVNQGNEGEGKNGGIVYRVGSHFGFFGGSVNSPALRPEQAIEISDVYSAVSLIAQRVAATPFDVMEIETKNNRQYRKMSKTHWAHILVNDRPNPYQTSAEFLETIMIAALLDQGALIYKAKDRTGKVIELWPMPMGSWEQELLSNGGVQYRVTVTKGKFSSQVVYTTDDVILIHGIGLDAYSGVSPIKAARDTLGISTSLAKAQKAFADNVGVPRGIVSTDHQIPDELERDALIEAISQKFAAGEHGIMLLDGATKFTSLSESFSNSQFIEQNEFITRRIAAVFKVPSNILLGGNVTDNDLNYLAQDGVRPWLIRIEQALNRGLLSNDTRFKFKADEHKHLRGDPIKQMDFITKALGSGGSPAVITQNEARDFLEYNPLDDERYDQISLGGYSDTTGLADAGNKEPKPKTEK